MAKVKTAKQRITDFLKAKGYDASEIQDAFSQLDEADTDLDRLAADLKGVNSKNQEWLDWYQTVVPEVQNVYSERDSLKQKLAKLEAAGVRIGDTAPITPAAGAPAAVGQYATADDLAQFKRDLISGTNTVMKGLTKVSLSHYREFNEEPDLEAIEKIVSTRGLPVEEAYRVWSEPKREESRKAQMEKEIERRSKEMFQSEISKLGISAPRKRKVEDIEPAPLDKAAPTDRELRDAFVNDLNTDVTH